MVIIFSNFKTNIIYHTIHEFMNHFSDNSNKCCVERSTGRDYARLNFIAVAFLPFSRHGKSKCNTIIFLKK